MRLRIALVRHAQVGPADAVTARHETAERFVVARLAANRHSADAEPPRGSLRSRYGGVERRHVAGDELENPYLILGPPFRERLRVPQHHGVQAVIPIHQRSLAQAEPGREGQLATDV